MNTTEIGEAVKVGAVFEGSLVCPKWFKWVGRKIDIKEITYTWETKHGEAPLLQFAVTDGVTMFELSFNKKSLEWRLEKSIVE